MGDREAMKVLFLTVLFAIIVTCGALAGLARLGGPAPAAAPAGGSSAAPPESLEGVLAAQLIAGEITRNQYRRAIEGIAARDDERHPLTVPPGAGPAAA